MNFLVIATFISCFLAAYFAKKLNLISVYFVLLPELLGGIVLLVVLARLIAGKRLWLDARYLVLIAMLLLTMAMGAVAQNVPSGAVVSGLRNYLPYLPMLLLGAIYPFTGRQIKAQLVVLGALLLIQAPIAAYQRFVSFADRMHTGDVVTGTAASSGTLSIVMICGVAVLAVLYLRRRLSLPMLLALIGFMLLPTMLNETKATLVMLPIAMLVPIFFMRRAQKPLRRLVPLAAVCVASGVVFVSVYDSLIQHRNPEKSIGQFWLEGGVQDYVYKGALEGDHRVGRVDSIQIAMRHISETPMRAAFGLGIGNVSPAQLPGFEGRYAHYYDPYKTSFTQLSMLLWNVGYVGVVVFGLLLLTMFRDAATLARGEGESSMLGQIWAPVVMIVAMSFLYKAVLTLSELMYPFMLYAGIVARHAYLVRQEQKARRSSRARGTSSWQAAPAAANYS